MTKEKRKELNRMVMDFATEMYKIYADEDSDGDFGEYLLGLSILFAYVSDIRLTMQICTNE